MNIAIYWVISFLFFVVWCKIRLAGLWSVLIVALAYGSLVTFMGDSSG
jgi:hypothetical protein